jgi:hypothetical protein
MLAGNFEPGRGELTIAGGVWVLLLLNAAAFSLLGFQNYRAFSTETRKKIEEGFPIESLEGFSSVSRSVSSTLASTSLITIVVFISLALYLVAISVVPTLEQLLDIFPGLADTLTVDVIDNLKRILRPVILFSALGLILIALGILLILKIPEKPGFEVGAFLKFYVPRVTPMTLDNLLSDSIQAFLDPITKMRLDEWTDSIVMALRQDFEPSLPLQTRMERAREKILLLFYLRKRMPIQLTEKKFEEELTEVIQSEKLRSFQAGESSGISFSVLDEVFDHLYNRIPEVFTTIDRLIIELTDNLLDFIENEDIWVSLSAPEKVSGNRHPFRILAFALNRNTMEFQQKKRAVTFHLQGAQNTFMEHVEYAFSLDEAESMEIAETPLPFITKEGNDIVGVLSRVLQIGDAIWFTASRRVFRPHIFNLSISENGRGTIFGETIKIDMVRDLGFYIQTYGGRLSALTGLILPFFSILFPF